MSHSENKAEFLSRISDCAGLIHKIVAIYTDRKEDGEDLLQEILYQSWKSYPSYRNESRFSTWLYKVSLNTALVYRKNCRLKAPATETSGHQTITTTG